MLFPEKSIRRLPGWKPAAIRPLANRFDHSRQEWRVRKWVSGRFASTKRLVLGRSALGDSKMKLGIEV